MGQNIAGHDILSTQRADIYLLENSISWQLIFVKYHSSHYWKTNVNIYKHSDGQNGCCLAYIGNTCIYVLTLKGPNWICCNKINLIIIILNNQNSQQ